MGRVFRVPLVLLIALCLILSAVLIPAASHLPRWTKAEIVMSVWWAIWFLVLAFLLYRGHSVDDTNPVTFRSGKTKELLDGGCAFEGCSGCAEAGGCEGIAYGIIAFGLIILALFVLVEFVIPAVALLLLASVGGMLARAVNDRRECEGRIGLSLLWGVIWSTIYIGPVAAIVIWLATVIHPHLR